MIFDPFGINNVFSKLQHSWLSHPLEWAEVQQEYAMSTWMLNFNTCAYIAGGYPAPCAKAVEADERFADHAWTDNPVNCLRLENYLTYTRWMERMLYDTPDVAKHERRTGAFWARQWFNAIAPSNFFFTNPVAIRKAWETNGASVLAGMSNFFADVEAGDVQMTPTDQFRVGENLATTPGAVVFRNEIMEVIHYLPMRKKVHAVPLVMVPPWINKYYVLDLDEKMSMVRHLLTEGFDIFVISWKNPTAEMAGKTYESYVLDGALAAIEVARAICNVPHVHAVGYCIGGTALATLMAWLNRKYDDTLQVPVAHWTLLSSLVDFSRPGEIESFINDESLATLDALMATQGYLDKKQIAWAFRMLRPNSLIWHYVVHKYLYGETPPPFSVLYWNADSTCLPRAMHRYCLRQFYLENNLAKKDALMFDGYPLDMARVVQPLYAVGATEDHITPWRGTFHTLSLVRSPARYTLSTSGHILGIINPPRENSSRHYWSGDATGATDGKEWRANQVEHAGSWWGDWTAWLHDKCGPMRTPPNVGHQPYPKLCDAPGTYVHEQ